LSDFPLDSHGGVGHAARNGLENVMAAIGRFSAYLRGWCSVFELHPTASRKAYRDSIIDAQANGLYDIWSQVGDLLREAQSEFSRKEAAQQGDKEGRVKHQTDAHPEA
jgi:hypothetical protein